MRKIEEREKFSEFLLPEEPESLDILLKRIKETERVIRQESNFLGKVRRFKPKIQLINIKKSETKSTRKVKSKKTVSNSPLMVIRTRIILPEPNPQ